MRVLFVCSGNSGHVSPFVSEQAEAVGRLGNEIEIFPIKGRGPLGYLRNVPRISQKIKQFKPDLIHAHYGLSGLAATLQSFRPVIITFHGSDAHIAYVRPFSRIAASLSSANIFVQTNVRNRIRPGQGGEIIPCGINFDAFFPMDKNAARLKLGLSTHRHSILFSSRFENKVKNHALAAASIAKSGLDVDLIELKGKTREEVKLLLNACDAMLLTSFSEGSPQIIKEAMACNCPIVTTDVGDIKWLIGDTDGCFLTSFDPTDVAYKIKLALQFSGAVGRTDARERIIQLGLDSETIAQRVVEVYRNVLAQLQS
jgi:glycosyltransferase involved in cell wall biosynthesis